MTFVPVHPAVLVPLCALGYAAAAIFMKAAAVGPQGWHTPAIVLALALAALTEIALLQRLELGNTYLAVLGMESVLVILAAAFWGESFGPREAAGAAMILSGTVMIGV